MIKLLTDAQHRNFLRLWLAQLISQFGDRVHQLALVGLIAERTSGSAVDLAKIMAFTILPVFLIQPFAGVFVDRWDRRTTLFFCDLARGGLVILIPLIFFFWQSMVPIYVIVFLAFCFSRFYSPAKMSILPDLVGKDYLAMANSLVSTTGMVAFVLGCAVGGFLIDSLGSRTGFMIDAATFFVSALFIFSIDVSKRLKVDKTKLLQTSREIAGPIRQSVSAELKEGLRYLMRNKEIRAIIGVLFTLLAAAGSVYVVLIVFVQESFNSVTRDLGVLAVCLGFGLFVGAVGYGKWGRTAAWEKTIFFCLLLGGAMLMLFAWVVHRHPDIWTAMALSFLMGVVTGPAFIAANTVIHLVSEEGMRGKMFSALEIVIHFAFLAAMFLSSVLSEFVPRVIILLAVGLGVMVVGISGLIKARKGGFALGGSRVA
jgi:MFS family permease